MWIIIIFGAIFASIALLLFGFTADTAEREKKTSARLEAIRLGITPDSPAEQPVDIRVSDTFSNVPWLNWLLHTLDIAPRLGNLLRQANLNWTVGRLLLMCVLLGAVAGYLVELRTEAFPLALCFAVFGGSIPILYVLRMRRARFDRIRAMLPDAIDLMVAAIRAGHSLSSAIGMVSRETSEPLRGEFRQCYDEQNFGLDLRTTMNNLLRRVPVHDIRIMSAAILIQKDTGGNLTEILDKVAYLIREDFKLQRQVRVHTAQGRLTGYILSALPLILGVGLYMINPEQMSLLWRRPIGVKLLYASGTSTTIGMLIIRRIIRVQV